jgi:cysteinyl-tRNA synthetase
MNITHVDDKIIKEFKGLKKDKAEFQTVVDYSHAQEKAFFADMEYLNALPPDSLLHYSCARLALEANRSAS